MSAWYAVNDDVRELVFVANREEPPAHADVLALLGRAADDIPWIASGEYRTVEEDDLGALLRTYRDISESEIG